MNPTRVVSIAIIAIAIIGVVAVSAGGDRVSRFGDARPSEEIMAPVPAPTQAAQAEQRPWFAPDDGAPAEDSGEDGDDWGEGADRPSVVTTTRGPGASPVHDPGYVPNPSIPFGVDDAGPDPNAE
jgi:hypothetical protein